MTSADVAWLGFAIIAVYVVVRAFMEIRRARRMRASRRRFTEPGPPRLTPGLTTLAGVVETDEPEGVALRLVTSYDGFALEREGGLRWGIYADPGDPSREIHPFTLVVAGTGARVRVRPEEDVNLLSWPEKVGEVTGRLMTHPFALSLHAGERVLVCGMLAASSAHATAYRGDEHPFILHAPREGSLVIESEHFAVRFERRHRLFRRIGDISFAVIALVHLILASAGLHGRWLGGSWADGALIGCVCLLAMVALMWIPMRGSLGPEWP